MNRETRIVNAEARTVSPEVFASEEIYRDEQEKIFGRCWLYLGHESQLDKPGKFLSTFMGEEPVIAWRGKDGLIRAFLNSCRHRGMKVCREDEGTAKVLTCPYHAWSYDNCGKLVGVPMKQKYDDSFDPKDWGLIEVARVDSYAGLVFGNFDPSAEPLEEYLGEIRWYLDTQFKRTPQGRVMLPGVQKWTLDINWKIGAEQFAGDNYHAPVVHLSAARLGLLGEPSKFAKAAPYEQDFEVCTTGGHGWINLTPSIAPFAPAAEMEAYEQSIRDAAEGRLTPKQAELSVTSAVGSVFPNFAFISFQGGLGLRMWHPRGPKKTELWIWNAADAEAPEWRKSLSAEANTRSFTAAGLIDIDDSEMWLGVQETVTGFQRRKYPMSYKLGAGTGRRENERPGLIDATPSEVGIFGFYQRWAELMGMESAR